MPIAKQLKTNFNDGEIDPLMLGRSDLEQYADACETMTNVIPLQQGGFRRRGGLQHVGKLMRQISIVAVTPTAPNGGTAGNANDNNTATSLTTTNNISTTNPYVVVQYDLGSAKSLAVVYLYDVALTVSGSSDEFYLQGSTNASSWTNIGTALATISTTARDFSRRVDNTYRYIRLVRIGATDLGTNKITLTGMNVYENGALSNSRHMSFVFSATQFYELILSANNIAVYLSGELQIDLYVPGLTNSMVLEAKYTQSADTLLLFHEDINPYKILRNGSDNNWIIETLAFTQVPYHAFTLTTQTGTALGFGTTTPSDKTGSVKLTLSSGSWPATPENQYVEGNGGRARILSQVSPTVVNAYVEIPFYNTDAIAAADLTYESGYEPAWSVSRGWPVCGAFHSGRLYIGGSKSRPTTIWGSRVSLFFDFDLGEALDDDGIEATIDKGFSRIVNIFSGRDLCIFTTAGEYIAERPFGEPLTPSNFNLLSQTDLGSKPNFDVFGLDGGLFYVQNGGRSVQEFIYFDTQQSYGNNLVSILSGHLVENPSSFTLRRASSLDEGALLIMTRDNGNCTIATLNRGQNVTGFANWTTDGLFQSAGVDYDDIYFVVQRTINSVVENYVELYNEDCFFDASTKITSGLPAATFTGLFQLEAKECRVYVDGSVLEKRTPSGGSVTIERNATNSFEIGLWFKPLVKDLPFETTDVGYVMGSKVAISEVSLSLYQTQSITVNGYNIIFRGFGLSGSGSPLDSAPPQFTGVKRIFGLRGWNDSGQITLSQNEAGPMTVRAMGKRVRVG